MSIWTNLWSQTAEVHEYAGCNDAGSSKFVPDRKSPGKPVPCRVEYQCREYINAKGEKVTSAAVMFCNVAIPPMSLIQADGQQFTVKSCEPCRGIGGAIDHYEIIL